MPDEPNSKRKSLELFVVFAVGGVAGFYLSRALRARQEPEQLGNQHWHSNKLQITAPGYAPADTTDASAMAELAQPELAELY